MSHNQGDQEAPPTTAERLRAAAARTTRVNADVTLLCEWALRAATELEKAAEAVAKERERCAQVAEGFEQTRDWVPGSLYGNLRREVAALIRRG